MSANIGRPRRGGGVADAWGAAGALPRSSGRKTIVPPLAPPTPRPRLQSNPWIEKVEIEKELPAALRVKLAERAARWRCSSPASFLRTPTHGRPGPSRPWRNGPGEARKRRNKAGLPGGELRPASLIPTASARRLKVAAELGAGCSRTGRRKLAQIEVLGEEDFRLHTDALPFPAPGHPRGARVGPKVQRLGGAFWPRAHPALTRGSRAVGRGPALSPRSHRHSTIAISASSASAGGRENGSLKNTDGQSSKPGKYQRGPPNGAKNRITVTFSSANRTIGSSKVGVLIGQRDDKGGHSRWWGRALASQPRHAPRGISSTSRRRWRPSRAASEGGREVIGGAVRDLSPAPTAGRSPGARHSVASTSRAGNGHPWPARTARSPRQDISRRAWKRRSSAALALRSARILPRLIPAGVHRRRAGRHRRSARHARYPGLEVHGPTW